MKCDKGSDAWSKLRISQIHVLLTRLGQHVPLKINVGFAKVWRKIFFLAKMAFSTLKNLEQPAYMLYIYRFTLYTLWAYVFCCVCVWVASGRVVEKWGLLHPVSTMRKETCGTQGWISGCHIWVAVAKGETWVLGTLEGNWDAVSTSQIFSEHFWKRDWSKSEAKGGCLQSQTGRMGQKHRQLTQGLLHARSVYVCFQSFLLKDIFC